MNKQQPTDVLVRNEGTLFIFRPLTASAKRWVEENVNVPDHMWLGDGFAVEHRYAPAIAEGMQEAGLLVI
jgi:hypothetical protein